MAVTGVEFPRIPFMPWSKHVKKNTPVLFDFTVLLSRELVLTEFLGGMDVVMDAERCIFRKRVEPGRVEGDDGVAFEEMIELYDRNRGGFESDYRFVFKAVNEKLGHLVLTAIIKKSASEQYWLPWDEVTGVAKAMGVNHPAVIWRGCVDGGAELRQIMDAAMDAVVVKGLPHVDGVVLRVADRLPEDSIMIGKLTAAPPVRGLETRLWVYPEE